MSLIRWALHIRYSKRSRKKQLDRDSHQKQSTLGYATGTGNIVDHSRISTPQTAEPAGTSFPEGTLPFWKSPGTAGCIPVTVLLCIECITYAQSQITKSLPCNAQPSRCRYNYRYQHPRAQDFLLQYNYI